MKEFKTVDEQILLLESRGVRCGEGPASNRRVAVPMGGRLI